MNIKPMQAGDIVYFKKCKVSLSRTAEEIGFKGHGWAVLLGMMPPFLNVPPPKGIVFQTFASIGLISFDDIGEFLGKEQADLVVKMATEKYFVKPKEEVPAAHVPPLSVVEKEEPVEEGVIVEENLKEPTSDA